MASKIRTAKSSAPSISVLANISQAAFEAGGKVKALVTLISEPYRRADLAGQTAIRNAFCYGDVAARLNTSLEKGKAIVELPKADAKDANRKTKAQQQAYDASRQLFSRFLRDAGLTTASTANNAGKNTGRTPRAGNTEVSQAGTTSNAQAARIEREVVLASKTTSEVRDYLRGQAQTMMAYIQKNAKLVPVGYSSAVVDFRRALEAADKLDANPTPAIVPGA